MDRFIAIGTDDLRSMLEGAWDAASADADGLLQTLTQNRTAAQGAVQAAVLSSAGNGHAATAFDPASDSPASQEVIRAWQRLIEEYRKVRKYLLTCAAYGQDAFSVFNTGMLPTSGGKVNPAVTVETDGDWTDLCQTYDVDPALVVGKPVGEESIYCWLLGVILVPVTESRADYSQAIIGRGGLQFT